MTKVIDHNAIIDRFQQRMADKHAEFVATYPHRVVLEKSVDWHLDHEFSEEVRWCHSNCTGRYDVRTSVGLGRGLASINAGIFSFANDRDAILFKMFWEEGA